MNWKPWARKDQPSLRVAYRPGMTLGPGESTALEVEVPEHIQRLIDQGAKLTTRMSPAIALGGGRFYYDAILLVDSIEQARVRIEYSYQQ